MQHRHPNEGDRPDHELLDVAEFRDVGPILKLRFTPHQTTNGFWDRERERDIGLERGLYLRMISKLARLLEVNRFEFRTVKAFDLM